MSAAEEAFELIDRYTRAQALEDGVLIDVTEVARQAGVLYPTALTHAVWHQYVAMTTAAEQAGCDPKGRLWDIVWMFSRAALHTDGSELQFQLCCVTDAITPSLVTLRALCGPGDDGQPVITMLLPEED